MRLARPAALAAALLALAGDWPQWLGPARDNSSAETVKPWAGGPKVLWRVPVAAGHSSPVAAGGRVYLHARDGDRDAERLTVYDAATGKEVANSVRGRAPFSNPFGVGPRATPTVLPDGQVVTLGVTGVLASESLGKAGVKAWTLGLLEQFKAPNLTFGVSASPLVDGDRVVTLVGGKGAGVVAFDRKTGEVAWKALDDAASYAAPVAVGEGARRQVVCLTGEGLVGLSPADGSLLWRFPFKDKLAESSTTPVVAGDLLIGSSITLGTVALRLGEKDGKPAVTEAWRNPELSCYFSTPVPVGGHLYMATGRLLPPPSIALRCVDAATGKVAWTKEKVGRYHAAMVRTGDGKLLMLDDTGHLTLIDPSPDGYKELARAKVCGATWAHPALSDGKVYLRDEKELIAVDLGG